MQTQSRLKQQHQPHLQSQSKFKPQLSLQVKSKTEAPDPSAASKAGSSQNYLSQEPEQAHMPALIPEPGQAQSTALIQAQELEQPPVLSLGTEQEQAQARISFRPKS